jgi:Metallo-peptidase family M12/Secretion system C-terminal sorting domain
MKTLTLFKTTISLLLIVCCTTLLSAQTRLSTPFTPNATAAKRADANPKVAYLALSTTELQQLFAAKPQTMRLALPYMGETITLDLQAHRVLAKGFCILQQTAHGIDTLPYAGGVYYKGMVLGAQGKSIASVSVFADHIVGTFSDVRGSFALGAKIETQANGSKRASTNDYVLFRTQDVPNPNAIGCFTDNDAPDAHSVAQSLTQQRNTVTQDSVRIYLEADYSLYNNFGSATATADYVTSVFNAVATIYDGEQITLRLAPIMVWAVQDSFQSDNPGLALYNFRNWRTTFDGEQAQLLSLYGNGGIAAGFNTFCTDRRYSFAGIQANFAALPAYSWTVEVSAHEFGHCFGSRHTHWCGWTGGAIDGCAGNVEPAPDGTSCTPTTNAPVGGGTIMSYCHFSNGINFANGFGQQPGDRIRACVANRYCTPNSTTGGVAVRLPADIYTNTYFWSVDGGAWLLSYDVAANITEGQHTVTFRAINGLRTPAPKTINVVRQQTTVVYADYNYPAGRVVVNITGGGGQGQWAYTSATAWKNSGDTANVPVSVTNLLFKPLVGWSVPVLGSFVLQDSTNYTFNVAYTPVPTGKITIQINGGDGLGKWFVTNNNLIPNTLHNSGDTITVNAESLYAIDFKNVLNWVKPEQLTTYTVANQTTTHTATYQALPLGLVSITLTGANGNGQWSVDMGMTWYNSGDTATTVQGQRDMFFKNINGWIKPQSFSINISNDISIRTAEYTAISYATVRINLVGGNGLGKWKQYGTTTWRNSGDTIQVPANSFFYTEIQSQALPGWITPYSFNIYGSNLSTTQENVYTLTYYRIRQASLRVNLTGDNGVGQWRVNTGAWRNSNDTAMVDMYYNGNNASYINYKTISNAVKPPSVPVPYNNLDTLVTATLTGVYIPTISRVLQVNLTGANGTGQWRMYPNGGSPSNWKNSSDTTLITNANNTYYIEYNNVAEWRKPQSTYINWASGTTTIVVDAAYTAIRYGAVRINLTGANGTGQWRLYDSYNYSTSAWKNSGDTVRRLSDMSNAVNRYSIQFSNVTNWQIPNSNANGNIMFAPNHTTTFTFHYTNGSTSAGSRLCVNLTGANGLGRWTIDGINLHQSGDTVNTVYGQYYNLIFVDINGWRKPYYNSLIGDIDLKIINMAYTLIEYGYLKLYLKGANGQGKWTGSNLIWQNSGDSVLLEAGISNPTYFTTVADWNKPNYSMPILVANQTMTDTAYYTPIQYGTVKVNLTGADGLGQWRVLYNNNTVSAWKNTGDTLHLQSDIVNYIDFKNVANWDIPNIGSNAFYINPNQTLTINGAYRGIYYGTLKVITVGDGGAGGWSETSFTNNWRNSGDTIHRLATQTTYVYFKPISGFVTPPNFSSLLHPNVENTVYGEYLPVEYFTFTGNIVGGGGAGQWRINNGAWHNHGDTIQVAKNTYCNLTYKNVANWNTPQSSSFSMTNHTTQTGTYVFLIRVVLKVKITGTNGQGRCNIGNKILYNNDTIHTYIGGNYYVVSGYVTGFIAPPTQVYMPTVGQTADSITLNYTPAQYAPLKVNLLNGNNEGAWAAVDAGQGVWGNVLWYDSGDTLILPTHKTYDIYFRNVAGWVSPPTQYNIATVPNTTTQTTGIYSNATQGLGTLVVQIIGDNGQGRWSADWGNTWRNSGDTVYLPLNQSYDITFKDINGYFTPNSQAYYPSQSNQITNFIGNYLARPKGVIKVNIIGGNGQGRWRINDETTWRNSGDTIYRTANFPHYIYYKDISGFITPSNDFVYPSTNQVSIEDGTYTPIEYGTLKVNLTGANALGQWRIDTSAVWHNSGDTLHLPTYNYHTVYCKDVSGFITPSAINISVYTNIPITVERIYEPIVYGILKINLVGATGLGKWRISSDTVWRNSGDTLHLSVLSGYNINYKNITGWIKPNLETYYPIANQQSTLTRTYTQIGYGTLKVNLTGGDSLGQWTADGGNTWHSDGDTVMLSNIQSSYSIEFKSVNGWVTPNYQIYTPIANQTAIITGIYIRAPFGILRVNLTGANGQGLWSTDQLLWHTSGDTIHVFNGNSVYIYFAPVANWIKPVIQNMYPSTNQTTVTVGNYTQPVGVEVNTPSFASTIMPNPANEYLRCRTSSTDIATPLQINLYNSLGVLLYSSSLSANDEHTVKTTDYPTGFYILQVFDPRTKAAILHKVIIQH